MEQVKVSLLLKSTKYVKKENTKNKRKEAIDKLPPFNINSPCLLFKCIQCFGRFTGIIEGS
jgi:hypothetical protein